MAGMRLNSLAELFSRESHAPKPNKVMRKITAQMIYACNLDVYNLWMQVADSSKGTSLTKNEIQSGIKK